MLKELMAEIEKGGTLEVNQLARRLNTTPAMVSMMLDQLQKNGALKPYQTCGEGCAGCSLASVCKSSDAVGGVKLWQFEEKTPKR